MVLVRRWYGTLNQQTYFVLGSTLAVLIGSILAYFNPLANINWLFGLAIGYVVQRSKLCFSAAVRDVLLFRSTALAKAVLLLIVTSTIGFALLQYLSDGMALTGKIYPAGWHIFIGAFIFAIGMVVAGGCVSSSVMRAGEWFSHYWFVIAGILIGTVLAAWCYPLWSGLVHNACPMHLPTLLGWLPAILLQAGLFLGIFLLIHNFE